MNIICYCYRHVLYNYNSCMFMRHCEITLLFPVEWQENDQLSGNNL